MVMGAPLPTITPSYTGFVNSETPSVEPAAYVQHDGDKRKRLGSYPSKCAVTSILRKKLLNAS
jgi:hypothetical protein